MNGKKLFGSILVVSVIVSTLFLSPPVTYAETPTAPFWYGTDYAYVPPPAGYDPTLFPYDPSNSPPTMRCDGFSPDSLAMNLFNNMGPIFGFDNNPSGIRGLYINNPKKSWDAYTLLSCMNGCAHPDQPGKMFMALLIDNYGHFIHGWENIKGFPARMWPGGDISGSDTAGTVIESPALVRQDWCGNEVWRWDSRDYDMPGTQFHHDYQRQGNPVGYYAPPIGSKFLTKFDGWMRAFLSEILEMLGFDFLPKHDGNVLALANHVPENEYYYPKGWVSEGHPARDTSHISTFALVDDAFYIIDHKGRIKWQWFACDHFEQMGFSDAAKYGIMYTQNGYPPKTDWTHFNNVNWLGPNKLFLSGDLRFHPNNMIFDSRSSSMLAIIAHSDYAKFKKGDIIWRVGPDYGPGTPWESLGQIIGPHNAHMIPATLPGGGNILVFDNGGLSCYGSLREDCLGTYPNALSDYSRILEFNPKTYKVVWEYTQPNPTADLDGDGVIKGNERKFFSSFMASAQRLVNGNTLICEANMGRVFEVTKEGEVVFEYYAGTGQTKPGVPGEVGAAVYRAYKVPKHWVPKKTCPE